MRVAVVGAGVIGVTAAVAVKEAFPTFEVTVFAEIFTPHTTGDGSAGLWGPFVLADTDPRKIVEWSLLTHKWMKNFWKSGRAAETGVSLLPCYRLSCKSYTKPEWLSVVYGGCELTEKELKRLSKANKTEYTGGVHFVTFTCEPVKLLPYLMKKLESMNGQFVQRKITDLKQLGEEGFDIVINCTGFGSKELVGDKSVSPVRGQVMRVKGPWLLECTLEEGHHGNYVIPNIDSTVLGGTYQEGDYDCSINPSDTKSIKEGCERIYPSIKKCGIISEWAGLRPGRVQVRLESEIMSSLKKKDLVIIHNYGHGGSGVTLCWGCALNVVEILHQQLKIKNLSKL
ncbi:D-aspartate oxidase [Copidosoma floridanum]|uniref:D-aspartate oxidase n=1 Tax=Copidosoma floridanum TaxID=29053 RepID=UPI0006C9D2DF|nr:D-aspartate oxidase [Copidosoma floridanum]